MKNIFNEKGISDGIAPANSPISIKACDFMDSTEQESSMFTLSSSIWTKFFLHTHVHIIFLKDFSSFMWGIETS